MANAKARYELAGEVFTSKAAVKRRVKAILARTLPGQRLSQMDQDFVADLFGMHPRYDEKVQGQSLNSFCVMRNDRNSNTKNLVAVLSSGEHVEFSYHKCIDGDNPRQQLLGAMRKAIEGQVSAARAIAYAKGQRCPTTGELLSDVPTHVHHATETFAETAALFLRQYPAEDIELENDVGGYGWVIADREVLQAWQDFHLSRARLEVVSEEAHKLLHQCQP